MWRVNWPRLHNITSRKCKDNKVSLLKRLDTLALSLRFHLLFLSSISLSASESSNAASNCFPFGVALAFPLTFADLTLGAWLSTSRTLHAWQLQHIRPSRSQGWHRPWPSHAHQPPFFRRFFIWILYLSPQTLSLSITILFFRHDSLADVCG
jgi:hypothetical protein